MFVNNWSDRQELMKKLAALYETAEAEIRKQNLPFVDPNSINVEKFNDGANDVKWRLIEHHKRQKQLLTDVERLQKQIDDTRKDDKEIADYYGLTVEELYQMPDQKEIDESREIQENLAKRLVLLADANKGFNNRVNGAADDLVRGIEKIRNDVIWPKGNDSVLHWAAERLGEAGVGPNSALSKLEDDLYKAIADGGEFLRDAGALEGNHTLFDDALKNTKLDQLKFGNGHKPKNFNEVAALLHDSHVGLEKKFKNAEKQTYDHYDWVVWYKNQNASPPGNDPNPWVPY